MAKIKRNLCTKMISTLVAVWVQVKDCKGEDWESLEKVRLPLTLNLSQCKLELGEYQEVIKLNSQLLKNHQG